MPDGIVFFKLNWAGYFQDSGPEPLIGELKNNCFASAKFKTLALTVTGSRWDP
jgi:hypothetical protein